MEMKYLSNLKWNHLTIKRILKQFIRFIGISGVGFLIDFSVYYFLTGFMGFHVALANVISSIPAITYVFILSTKKVFVVTGNNRLKVGYKYIIYLLYQILLVCLVSILAQKLYDVYIDFEVNYNIIITYVKLIIKCLITPITMTCNFIFMKILSEKV
jgi:putative flippase GtrA